MGAEKGTGTYNRSYFTSVEAAGLKSGSSNVLVETVNPQGTFTDGP